MQVQINWFLNLSLTKSKGPAGKAASPQMFKNRCSVCRPFCHEDEWPAELICFNEPPLLLGVSMVVTLR
jgi:hypothetical protein